MSGKDINKGDPCVPEKDLMPIRQQLPEHKIKFQISEPFYMMLKINQEKV